MKAKIIVSWLLIFALVMPALILATTGTAYAFAGIELNDKVFNMFKALLAIFFLTKITSGDEVDQSYSSNSSDQSSFEKENIIEEENQSESKLVEENNRTQRETTDWTTEEIKSLSYDERRMLELLNEERKERGLKPLQINFGLVKVARAKSEDMIKESYFSHFSPNYGSPFDMMKKLDIQYYLAGENIAGADKVEWAHRELMKSKSHRDNILHPEYTHVGIGIIDGGAYGKIYSQEFADLEY